MLVTAWRRLGELFPDREFFMRSQGQVRFLRISSRMQIFAALSVMAVLLAYVVSMGAMAISQISARGEHSALLQREAKVATAESRVAAYRQDLGDVVDDLTRRQSFIEEMVNSLPEDIKDDEAATDSRNEAEETARKIGAALPEASGLAGLEARQLAFVERLTRFAERRTQRAADALRQLGLEPENMMAPMPEAQGGPLLALATGRNGELDPRFERMAISLTRMAALEQGLSGVPQVMPADYSQISSGFGYRRDPFNTNPAMHSGLDFKGPIGAPIRAAAQGKISFVGTRSGYGKTIEISHGNGLMTRYAHMSAYHAEVGQMVDAGHVIGAIGNTGRSTGPHLHFEVRINDRAVNPRPFLEKARHVLEKARNDNTATGA